MLSISGNPQRSNREQFLLDRDFRETIFRTASWESNHRETARQFRELNVSNPNIFSVSEVPWLQIEG